MNKQHKSELLFPLFRLGIVMNAEIRGYKPQVLMQLVNLPKERFRYWRAHLDPNPHRSHFTFSDIFAYRIMKSFIDDRREEVAFLAGLDWSTLFTKLANTSYKELRKMVIVLDSQPAKMTIEYLDKANYILSNKVSILYLAPLVDEQFSSFVELGSQNVVSIKKAKKA